MLDENHDTTAGVRVIRRRNARVGVSAIKSQSEISRNPERRIQVEVEFLITDKVCRMKRDKAKNLSFSCLKTSGIPLKSTERVKGGR